MKYIILLILFSPNALLAQPKELINLEKMLISYKSISYNHKFINYNPFTGQKGITDSAKILIQEYENIFNSQYLISNNRYTFGYNGKSTFYINKDKKKLIYKDVNQYNDLMGKPFLYFSITWLKKIVSKILVENSLSFISSGEMSINGHSCFICQIHLSNKAINNEGELVASKNNNKLIIYINKKNHKPVALKYYSNKNIIWDIHFNNIKREIFNDEIFSYNSYLNQVKSNYSYKQSLEEIQQERKHFNKKLTNSKSKNWKLPSIVGDTVELYKFPQAKLIKFWFPYCTGCIKSIPIINNISKQYQHNLKVFGIEFTKNDSSGLHQYITKMNIEYPVLYGGNKVAQQYNVNSGPTFFLIDENNIIRYASEGLQEDELIEALKSILSNH